MKENSMINRIGGKYICSIDGIVLVDLDTQSKTSCSHFEWWEISKALFYLGIGDIDPQELERLRKSAIMIFPEGMFVSVLVPRN